MRRLILVLFVALIATPVAAQAPAPDQPASSVAQTPAGDAPAGRAPAASGLPAREAPPRTLRAYWHLFGAFAITWVLLFGYALSIGRRMTRLDGELQRLKG